MAGAHRPDVTAIPLGRPSPGASSNQPERQGQRTSPATPEGVARRSYSVLLPAGLAMPPALPPARCALTAPFHPCRRSGPCGPRTGGLLSVALSLGSPPPDVIRRRIRLEPGLSSASSGGRPADWLTRAYGPNQRRSSGIERAGWNAPGPRTASSQPQGSFIEASLELWERGAADGERCAAALRLLGNQGRDETHLLKPS